MTATAAGKHTGRMFPFLFLEACTKVSQGTMFSIADIEPVGGTTMKPQKTQEDLQMEGLLP